jgi:phospholipid/cholesterol/gamma-HCH transport system permease protein
MRALGASPIRKLVVPRVIGVVVMLPVLTLLADFLGIVGGLFIAVFEIKIGAGFYVTSVLQALKYNDLMHGLCKTPVFGFQIAMIACYNGLNATGGADGVGRATTTTVVLASIFVLVSDFFLTKLFLLLPLGIE